MKVTIDDAGPCRKMLRISAAADEVDGDYRRILQAYASQAKVAGFRVGKAPLQVVEREYRREISDETRDRLIPRFYNEAIKEKNIAPVAVLDVKDIEFKKDTGLAFNIIFDVAPEFKLPKYKRIPLDRYNTSVTDDEVDNVMKRILEGHAEYQDCEDDALVEEGNIVQLDFEGMIDGQPIGHDATGKAAWLGQSKDFWTLAGDDKILPGIGSGIIGMGKGGEKDIGVEFPADFREASVAGKSASYKVCVKGIRRKIVPELNDNILKLYEAADEAALREKIRADLLSSKDNAESGRLRDEVAKFLLDKTEFELPQSIVDDEKDVAIRNIVERLARSGGTSEDIRKQRDEILDTATRWSKSNVKLRYILDKIAETEAISITDEDIAARIKEMGSRLNVPEEKVRSELSEHNGMKRLEDDIRRDKVMEHLIAEAKITNKDKQEAK